ncbi:hypothetical protein HON52_04845 [Candidatus Uhrbacteria bacterium]|jgi:hypothetical protein|nr:hypothetical protein [Candidatus Uhrbacteria bacterium]
MLRGIVKLLIILLVVGGFWWWTGSSEEDIRLDVDEVGYQEVTDLLDLEVVDDAPEDTPEDIVEEETDDVEDVAGDSIEDIGEAEVIVDDGEGEGEGEGIVDQEDASDDEDALPLTFNLAVPFTSQAPYANWDLPYQEACEEASAYMVWLYFQGEPSGLVDPGDADEAIWDLVDFQNDLFGHYLDTTAEQTREFIDLFYNMTVIVEEDPSVELIKKEIAAGRPVIVPAAGKELGNPYFSGDGPLYHMFVIKGYTEDQFIVNDPGTKRGQDYVYDIDVVMAAMGDWNDGDPANGAKRVILLAP